jgi:DNA segregation ATPase FtsK/SpoIIIE-like protein
MEESDEIEELINEITFRKSNSKDYQNMRVEEISKEFKEIMRYEQESFKRIEEFEKTQQNSELIEYAKILCSNTIAREISDIQEIYLKKIDEEYLNSK